MATTSSKFPVRAIGDGYRPDTPSLRAHYAGTDRYIDLESLELLLEVLPNGMSLPRSQRLAATPPHAPHAPHATARHRAPHAAP